jgi:creatinine amidohydrolase
VEVETQTALGGMTWTDVAAPLLVVPLGSCEQHGPHLPLHTDTVIAGALADRLAAARADCVVAPPLAISASGEHAGFPGTLSIGTEVMTDVVIELVRSADWAAGVVLVNGHGGNATAVERAAAVCAAEGRRLLVWWPRVAGGDPHAGHVETSLMLAIAPGEVRMERAVAGPVAPIAELVVHGVRALSESGVLGDPTAESAAAGEAILARLVADLAGAVQAWVDGRPGA